MHCCCVCVGDVQKRIRSSWADYRPEKPTRESSVGEINQIWSRTTDYTPEAHAHRVEVGDMNDAVETGSRPGGARHMP
jgi:hypothetical protein